MSRPLLPSLLRAAAFAGLAAAVSACSHAQQQGPYAFVADQVVRDDCGLLSSPDALWDGNLIIDGEIVRVEYQLFNTELDGKYKEVSDTFYADGSAAKQPGFGGASACTFDMVNIHLEGSLAPDPNVFTGTLRITTRTLANLGCECTLETTFTATHTP